MTDVVMGRLILQSATKFNESSCERRRNFTNFFTGTVQVEPTSFVKVRYKV
jgi:hypothetical protein